MPNGAASSIHAERIDNAFPTTVIVEKTVEDVKGTIQDQLGVSKNLGTGVRFHQDQVFGIKNDGKGWNAAKCIHGEPTQDREIMPDDDLGRCTKINCRNTVRTESDNDRVFGCPSIRTDIPGKRLKSVADHQNYGDEPEAIDLLCPATFVELGISETDFERPRSYDEIKSLFEKIGYSYKIGKFNAIFNRAKQYSRTSGYYENDCVSIRAFMCAINDLHYVD